MYLTHNEHRYLMILSIDIERLCFFLMIKDCDCPDILNIDIKTVMCLYVLEKKLFIEPSGKDKGILREELLQCKPKMCRQQSCPGL